MPTMSVNRRIKVRWWHGGLLLTCIAVFAGFGLLIPNFELFPEEVEHHTEDAPAFCKQEVSPLLRLPEEVVILEVKKTSVWMDNFYEVKFSLPPTRSPEQWLKHLWTTNKFADGAQEHRYRFSAYHASEVPPGRTGKLSNLHHGHRSLEYSPDKDLYVAEVGTD
jgi:hypothetical protein